MTQSITRRQAFTRLGAAAATPLATPALAQSRIEWRMVTSWPKNLPGPGVSAQRIADRITMLSGERLVVTLYAAGEIVPALEVFDAVANGTAQMAHTASLFWSGKVPAAPLFTAGPFGLTPLEHITWIDHGGGQQVWDDLYAPFNIRPLMAGNTGYQMGGWFKEPLQSLDDLKGLRIRMPGLGGDVMRELGAAPVTLAPGDILPALENGTIDATEFLGPSSDLAMGFYRAAKNYYTLGWHEPNGTGEALLSMPAFDALAPDLQAIVRAACAEENIRALGESEWLNAARLKVLTEEKDVTLRDYPADIVEAARKVSADVLAALAAKDAASGAVVDSFLKAGAHLKDWSDQSVRKFLSARARA